MNAIATTLVVIFGVAGIICAAGLLFSIPVMLLWNGCLVPAVAGLSEVTWLQSWGIMIVCGMLFKSTTSK